MPTDYTPSQPPVPTDPDRQPSTRGERREAARRAEHQARLAAAQPRAARRPVWKSPFVVLTAAAIGTGLAVVILASGALGGPKSKVGNILVPLRPVSSALIDPANPRALGSPTAPVTIEVYSDFQCPACDTFSRTVEPGLIDTYVATGKARLVYRDFAFLDGGKDDGESQQAAAAARCSGDKFWAFHDYLFENQSKAGENKGTFNPAFLASVADAVGTNRPAYDACMANGAANQVAAVKAETAVGTAAGVGYTPSIFLNGKAIAGGAQPLTVIGSAIDALLPAGSSAP